MTLIVGTLHWKGICLNADTRATNVQTGKYTDDILKIAHVHGGIGMAASGNAHTAIAFRETLRKKLDANIKSGRRLKNNESRISHVLNIIQESLVETPSHQELQNIPIENIYSKGLIGVNMPQEKMVINSKEANNLMEILVNSSVLNSIYSRTIEKISWCANSKFNAVELSEFEKNVLLKYELDKINNTYTVQEVPFGEVVAFGSGSEFDYKKISPRIMSWVLFSPEGENIENASQHLTSMQAYADAEVDVNPKLGFKTFGGGIIAGAVRNIKQNGIDMGETGIVLGEYGLKKENRIVSKTYQKGKDLWIETYDGENMPLKPFPECLKSPSLLL